MKSRGVMKELVTLAVVFVISMGIGIGVNAIRADGIPLVYERPANQIGATAATGNSKSQFDPGIHIIDLETTKQIMKSKSALIVDARPDLFFEFGHIPDAENLARKNLDADYERLEQWLTPAREGKIPLLIYCANHHCEDAGVVTQSIQKNGFPTVLIFEGGYQEWENAGEKVVQGK